jgi:hypothetical protein
MTQTITILSTGLPLPHPRPTPTRVPLDTALFVVARAALTPPSTPKPGCRGQPYHSTVSQRNPVLLHESSGVGASESPELPARCLDQPPTTVAPREGWDVRFAVCISLCAAGLRSYMMGLVLAFWEFGPVGQKLLSY